MDSYCPLNQTLTENQGDFSFGQCLAGIPKSLKDRSGRLRELKRIHITMKRNNAFEYRLSAQSSELGTPFVESLYKDISKA